MDFFKIFAKNYPQGFGSFLAIIGVLILTPDTMVMRFSNLERWELMGFRGILMGVTLFFIWYFFFKSGPINKLSSNNIPAGTQLRIPVSLEQAKLR